MKCVTKDLTVPTAFVLVLVAASSAAQDGATIDREALKWLAGIRNKKGPDCGD